MSLQACLGQWLKRISHGVVLCEMFALVDNGYHYKKTLIVWCSKLCFIIYVCYNWQAYVEYVAQTALSSLGQEKLVTYSWVLGNTVFVLVRVIRFAAKKRSLIIS